MKNYKLLLFIFLLGSLNLLTSCGDDDEVEMPDPVIFSCKVDGEVWQATRMGISVIGGADFGNNITGKSVNITAIAEDGSNVKLVLSDFEANNTTQCIDAINYYGPDHPNQSQNKTVELVPGENLENSSTPVFTPVGVDLFGGFIGANSNVEILSCEDGKLSGTFEFIGVDLFFPESVLITEGVFQDIEFTYQ